MIIIPIIGIPYELTKNPIINAFIPGNLFLQKESKDPNSSLILELFLYY